MSWKMCERGNKIHGLNIPDVIQGYAKDSLCPIFLSRDFKTSEYSSIQRRYIITYFFSNNHRRFLRKK